MKRNLLLGLGMAAGLVATAMAKDEAVPEHDLSDFKLGAHVTGDEVDLSKQDGQVVVIEYWGTR